MVTTSERIKNIVETHTSRILEENAFMVSARDGRVSVKEFETYLQNVLFNLQNTPISLKLAVERAEQMNLKEMADFFRDKIIEEYGHDVWAMNDLKNVGARHDGVNPQMITDATRTMVQFGRDLIATHPSLYFAYMFCLEYFVLLAGPSFAESLKNCPIPNPTVTAVSNHIELDKEHVVDDLDVIERMVQPEHREQLVAAVDQMMTLVDGCLGANVGHA